MKIIKVKYKQEQDCSQLQMFFSIENCSFHRNDYKADMFQCTRYFSVIHSKSIAITMMIYNKHHVT